jgi:hypothetical protein
MQYQFLVHNKTGCGEQRYYVTTIKDKKLFVVL